MLSVAKSAGFCFGVKNAINILDRLLDKQKKVATLGKIIHSSQVVDIYIKNGVRVVEDIAEVKDDEFLVIRSHGVGPDTYEYIKKRRISFKDATCPFVKRIHSMVVEKTKKGYTLLIAGDIQHVEVKGIMGYSYGRCFVFSSLLGLKDLLKKEQFLKYEKLFLVAQTTFDINCWRRCVEYINSLNLNISIFCSICSATVERQREAFDLSKKSDIVFVVGSKDSSNTKKLYDICRQNCRVFFLQDLKDLKDLNYDFKEKKIALTAGASTPDFLIEQIVDEISALI